LPREDQLRQMIGSIFLSLDAGGDGFVVTVSGPGRAFHTEPQSEASDAYALALLYVFRQATDTQARDSQVSASPASAR
jgi:hypothetical protein